MDELMKDTNDNKVVQAVIKAGQFILAVLKLWTLNSTNAQAQPHDAFLDGELVDIKTNSYCRQTYKRTATNFITVIITILHSDWTDATSDSRFKATVEFDSEKYPLNQASVIEAYLLALV